jgi:hypothetical protein
MANFEVAAQLSALSDQGLVPTDCMNCEQPAAWLPSGVFFAAVHLNLLPRQIVHGQHIHVLDVIRDPTIRKSSPTGSRTVGESMEGKQHAC